MILEILVGPKCVGGLPVGKKYGKPITETTLNELIADSRHKIFPVKVQMKCRDGKHVPYRFFDARSAEDLNNFSEEGGISHALIRWGQHDILAHSVERARQL